MGLFGKEATNWKYILIIAIFTILVGAIILSFAEKVGKDILAISQGYELENQ